MIILRLSTLSAQEGKFNWWSTDCHFIASARWKIKNLFTVLNTPQPGWLLIWSNSIQTIIDFGLFNRKYWPFDDWGSKLTFHFRCPARAFIKNHGQKNSRVNIICLDHNHAIDDRNVLSRRFEGSVKTILKWMILDYQPIHVEMKGLFWMNGMWSLIRS